jgi:uncharacterized membrane protein (DUF373 family)
MEGNTPSEDHTDLMHEVNLEHTRLIHVASGIFHRTEQFIYIVLGALLAATALVALAGAGQLLWAGMHDWMGTDPIFEVIDRLLFVLMLIEILYTVRVSMRTGALSSEPFLVVALIACIRRILIISLETSHVTRPETWTGEKSELFHAAMTELGVLAGLVIVMVGAIFFVRRLSARPEA